MLSWDDLDRIEAEQIFERYIDGHAARLADFEKAYSANRGKKRDLSYRPDSLDAVWKWAMKRFQLPATPLPASEVEGARAIFWAPFDPIEYCRLGHDLAALTDGLGAYVAETILRADTGAAWSLEDDRRNGGYNEPAVRVGDGMWRPIQATYLCSKGWRGLDLGYGNNANDPRRLREVVGAILDAGRASSPAAADVEIESLGASLHLTFSDEVAHGESDAVDRFVGELNNVKTIRMAHREDRDVVVAELDHGQDGDTAAIEVEQLWHNLRNNV